MYGYLWSVVALRRALLVDELNTDLAVNPKAQTLITEEISAILLTPRPYTLVELADRCAGQYKTAELHAQFDVGNVLFHATS